MSRGEAGAVRSLIISLVVHATDAERLARFWAAVLGWRICLCPGPSRPIVSGTAFSDG